MKNLLLLLLSFTICSHVLAQSQSEKKVRATSKELFDKIAHLDSAVFEAYNSKNVELMKTYFTKDLEWYQDNGGLIDYEKVFVNFQSIFNRDYDLKRNLIQESLEVHPIEGFGAIETGKHQFKHVENGKLEIGTFRFLMIWKNENGQWKISRVVSYDH
jgi:ketosteroid isomerase-like protein